MQVREASSKFFHDTQSLQNNGGNLLKLPPASASLYFILGTGTGLIRKEIAHILISLETLHAESWNDCRNNLRCYLICKGRNVLLNLSRLCIYANIGSLLICMKLSEKILIRFLISFRYLACYVLAVHDVPSAKNAAQKHKSWYEHTRVSRYKNRRTRPSFSNLICFKKKL